MKKTGEINYVPTPSATKASYSKNIENKDAKIAMILAWIVLIEITSTLVYLINYDCGNEWGCGMGKGIIFALALIPASIISIVGFFYGIKGVKQAGREKNSRDKRRSIFAIVIGSMFGVLPVVSMVIPMLLGIIGMIFTGIFGF